MAACWVIATHSAYNMFSWYKYLSVILVFSHPRFMEWEFHFLSIAYSYQSKSSRGGGGGGWIKCIDPSEVKVLFIVLPGYHDFSHVIVHLGTYWFRTIFSGVFREEKHPIRGSLCKLVCLFAQVLRCFQHYLSYHDGVWL